MLGCFEPRTALDTTVSCCYNDLCICISLNKFCLYYFQISGREMFEFNPDLVDGDDAEATDDTIYTRGLRDEVCIFVDTVYYN